MLTNWNFNKNLKNEKHGGGEKWVRLIWGIQYIATSCL